MNNRLVEFVYSTTLDGGSRLIEMEQNVKAQLRLQRCYSTRLLMDREHPYLEHWR